MSWRTIAAVLIVVFSLALVQSVLAAPFISITSDLNDTGDYSNLEGVDGYNGNTVIDSLMGDWFNMGLVGMFGIMVWGVARVVRNELTRGGGL